MTIDLFFLFDGGDRTFFGGWDDYPAPIWCRNPGRAEVYDTAEDTERTIQALEGYFGTRESLVVVRQSVEVVS